LPALEAKTSSVLLSFQQKSAIWVVQYLDYPNRWCRKDLSRNWAEIAASLV